MALAALAVAGMGMQVYSRWKQGRAEASAYQEQASLLGLQAEEIMARAQINNDLIAQEGQKLRGRQTTVFAAQGVDVNSVSALAKLEDTARQVSEEIYRNTRDARYEADVLQKEAGFQRRYAKEAKRSATFDSIGSILTGAYAMGK